MERKVYSCEKLLAHYNEQVSNYGLKEYKMEIVKHPNDVNAKWFIGSMAKSYIEKMVEYEKKKESEDEADKPNGEIGHRDLYAQVNVDIPLSAVMSKNFDGLFTDERDKRKIKIAREVAKKIINDELIEAVNRSEKKRLSAEGRQVRVKRFGGIYMLFIYIYIIESESKKKSNRSSSRKNDYEVLPKTPIDDVVRQGLTEREKALFLKARAHVMNEKNRWRGVGNYIAGKLNIKGESEIKKFVKSFTNKERETLGPGSERYLGEEVKRYGCAVDTGSKKRGYCGPTGKPLPVTFHRIMGSDGKVRVEPVVVVETRLRSSSVGALANVKKHYRERVMAKGIIDKIQK